VTVGHAAVAETHSGVVFFLGDRAYKLKKAVDLGFLDFRSREARLEACRREVALNRRLAPDVYLGVADVVGADGRLADHLVVMQRMPDDCRLSTITADGDRIGEELDRLAEVLADFHAKADRSPAIDASATRDAIAALWESNALEMAPFRDRPLDPSRCDDVISLARRFLAGRAPLFDQRIAEGRVCDGHGDLLADDIFCLDDGPRVLDCLEFDDHLRFGDVLADVAFLAMDLERLGRPEEAARFLEGYRAAAADCWPDALAHHYIAYRAQVRAKVAALRWSQGDAGSAAAAGRLLDLCYRHISAAQVRLVIVGGLPGTGKSTVAKGLASALGGLLLRTDEVRKELAGLDPLQPSPAGLDEGLYRPAMTESTYTELLTRARRGLGLGRTVVMDGTWRDPRWRAAAADVGRETSSNLFALRCEAPFGVTVDRIDRRRATGDDPSDATEAVARALATSDSPWPVATTIDTAQAPADALAAAVAAIEARGPSTL
jgi:aminoglycoside phosphotransferase family enzyme/predicted kinase